jgi:membrane protein required for colicin V production
LPSGSGLHATIVAGGGTKGSQRVHWIDLLIVGVIAWMTFTAFTNGLIREVVKLIALVLGAVLAGMFYDDLSQNLSFLLDDGITRNLISFGALLGGTLILGQIVAGMLRGTAKLLMLGPFDHLGGAAFGLAKGVILVELALIAVSVFPASSQVAVAVEESALAPVFLERVPIMELALPDEFDDALDRLREWQTSLPAAVGGLSDGS